MLLHCFSIDFFFCYCRYCLYDDDVIDNLIESDELNISQVNRDNFGSYKCDMLLSIGYQTIILFFFCSLFQIIPGPYKCVATNGIPPAATQRINLLVTCE